MAAFILSLAALLAAQSPDPAASGEAIVIPFETGQMRYALRFWSTGREECVPTGTGPRFVAAAEAACRQAVADARPDPAPGGELLVDGTIVFSVVRAGETPRFAVDPPRPTAFLVEADLEIAADGSVVACTPIRLQVRPGDAGRLEQICPALQMAGARFVPVGPPPWRGRLLIVFDADGPAADLFGPGARQP
jgi:hypothetical protein